ncbi:MAG: tRNA dimethylallyltransferase, partial [Pseudomonadota bacterium]|nr:tRNA dimethylallyltransferase [Pseudomonadota bacterium]
NAGRYGMQAREALAAIRRRGKVALVVGGCGLYLRALLGRSWHQGLPKDTNLRSHLDAQSTTALYEQLQTLAPQRASELHANDRVRVHRAVELALLRKNGIATVAGCTRELLPFVIYLCPPRAEVRQRIYLRTQMMLAQGLIDEVKALQAVCANDCKPLQSIGYRQVLDYLQGKLDYQVLAARISTATCQYAKRQTTWFNNRNMLPNVVRVHDLSP